jgi:hypothetical protein
MELALRVIRYLGTEGWIHNEPTVYVKKTDGRIDSTTDKLHLRRYYCIITL